MGRGQENITLQAAVEVEVLIGNRSRIFRIEVKSSHDTRRDAATALSELITAIERLPRAENGEMH
jgi:hypothetical protein